MKTGLILLILLALFMCDLSYLYGFGLSSGSTIAYKQTSSTTKSRSAGEVVSKPHTSVINILIKAIDDHYVYAKDGRSFSINSTTKIINNHKPDVKVLIGELFFRDGNLVTIILK